ncbi:MAG: AAA family ATPase [Alphaproteobacteria bacterium]
MNSTTVRKAFALLRTAATQQLLIAAAETVGTVRFETRIGRLDALEQQIRHAQDCSVVLLDLDLRDPEEFAAVARVVQALGDRAAVVASSASRPTVDHLRQLMRLGVADFLPQPFQAQELSGVLNHRGRAVHKDGATHAAARGRVLSFTGCRGGIGTTTLAVQTAHALASRRGAKTAPSVCLIDLDLQFGNTAFYLDLVAEHGLVDLIEAHDKLDLSLFKGSTVRHRSGLDLIAAPNAVIRLDALEVETVGRIIELARESHDYVVIDVPTAWMAWKREVLARSDRIFLATQLTVVATREARRQLDLIRAEELHGIPLSVLANRVRPRAVGSLAVAEAERALGRAIDVQIGSDFETVVGAIENGVAIAEIRKGSRVAKDIERLVDGVTGEDTERKARRLPMLPRWRPAAGTRMATEC